MAVTQAEKIKSIAGAGQALALARLLKARAGGRRVLYIARDSLDAQHLIEELAFFAPECRAVYLPDWDILPYDSFSPSAGISSQRIAALIALQSSAVQSAQVIITPPPALLLPYAPPAFFLARAFHLNVGDAVSLPALTDQLQTGGYARVDRVLVPGEYALYGGQVDIFPLTAESPFRLVLADDSIEQIRVFDPQTQLSIRRQDAICLTPGNEYDFSDDGIARFTHAFYELFGAKEHAITRAVRRCQTPPGLEFYLPLFYEPCGRLLDCVPAGTWIMHPADLPARLEEFLAQAKRRYSTAASNEEEPALPVAKLFTTAEACLQQIKNYERVVWQKPDDASKAPILPFAPRQKKPLAALGGFVSHFAGRALVVTDHRSRQDAIAARLRDAGVAHTTAGEVFAEAMSSPTPLTLAVAPLRAGFIDGDASLAVFTEAEIFERVLAPRARRQASGQLHDIVHPHEIREGELIVHEQYGIGKVRGLQNRRVDGQDGEYLELEYADGQRLWLPIAQMHLLSRHYGDDTALSKMGGRAWVRAQARAAAAARDTAARILEINARRAAATKEPYNTDIARLDQFIGEFPYIETPDQARVTAEIKTDLFAPAPMDRLVTADVGFGKTEISMRAAAAVVFAGGQVAVIAPTTLLAEQHYRVFCERFADYAMQIACLTRATTGRDRQQIITGLAAGEINILIGTHAILQKSIRFANLRLAVVDEEHRFGVRHKEQFKIMRASVDLLALSATPIPRTFAMALDGVRELSIMATPPIDRLAIKSFIMPYLRSVVVDACVRELQRGGQVFFVHNEIHSIGGIAASLREWLPNARIQVVHGSMPPTTLETTMRRFVRREVDILLATTIIESGIDIQNANTILINRADRMGISRLHQLRGRVGRGALQAYAYFLTPEDIELRPAAEARLRTLTHHSNLGGGFHLSMRDLEMRGMGELLGERQSGVVETVGCELYQRMVASALRRLQGQGGATAGDSDISTQIALARPAYLPDSYIASPNERIVYYRRLTDCQQQDAVDAVGVELEDRFGVLPPPARQLLYAHQLRLLAQSCEVLHIKINKDHTATVQFAPEPRGAALLLDKIKAGECRATAASNIRLPLVAKPGSDEDDYTALLNFLQDIADYLAKKPITAAE